MCICLHAHAPCMYVRTHTARSSAGFEGVDMDVGVNKKRSFGAAFKLRVAQYVEMNTNRGSATKYGVNEKQVRQWRMKKADLKELPKKKKRMDGGGRKPMLPDIETVLLAWIDELRAGHLRITRNGIQRKATELARSDDDTEFIASGGGCRSSFTDTNSPGEERHQLARNYHGI